MYNLQLGWDGSGTDSEVVARRAATLLQSSGIAYRYGVSGPFWYASGATVQILLFATLAIELKRKAPNAHTFLVRFSQSSISL